MRLVSSTLALAFCACPLLTAQQWEVGASAGYGTVRNVSVTSPAGAGKTGVASGFAFGAVGGNDMHRYFGGEARYTYRAGDLKLSVNGPDVKLNGEAHAIHYDFLVYGSSRESAVRPFLAAGAGIKMFRGTGQEASFQPLSNIAVLSRTSEVKPLVSVGGGLKIALSRRALVRFDVRDYATPFPDKVIAPRRDTRVGGWLHDFVFLVGISTTL